MTRIGFATQIEDVSEFNRRALVALNGVDFGDNTTASDIVRSCRLLHGNRKPLSEAQQKMLIFIVHCYRSQITDRLVTEYAARKARGHDQ